MWCTDDESDPNFVHVYPTFDSYEHVLFNVMCGCHPEVDAEEPRLIIHNEVH